MLFGLSLSLSKKKEKNVFFLNKCTEYNWDRVHRLPFQLYYLRNFLESSKPARLVMAYNKQDPIIAFSLKFKMNSLNHIAIGFGFSVQQNF